MEYEIVVFDLLDFSRSDGYNPFRYIRDDKDVLKLIENLIRNTTPAGARSSDPFWEKAETALLEALMLYLIYEEPEEKQNFGEIMDLLGQAEIREDDETYKSSLDRLFGQLEPDHIAARQYGVFTKSAGRTAKSIIISVMVRLSAFNLPQVRSITEKDEMRFGELGEKKKAIFAVIPDNDASLSYLVGMMISQMVQELYYQADRRHGGKLPVHVRMLLDEYANLALPDSFDQALATMRSREISATVIVQNLAQLKTIHKDHRWESLVGNADTMVYLGGNELSTHEYISKMLGKETIDTRDHSETKGQHGSWSTQMHRTGRELLTPDEVRMLDNRYALVFIRGFRPVKDEKYDLLSHPNYALTGEATGLPYVHREPERWKPFLENFDFAHADAYILYQEEENE
jgi:type IV secretion system protein VirD4